MKAEGYYLKSYTLRDTFAFCILWALNNFSDFGTGMDTAIQLPTPHGFSHGFAF